MNFLDKISEYFSSHDNLINASTVKFNKISKSKVAQILDIEKRSLDKSNKIFLLIKINFLLNLKNAF